LYSPNLNAPSLTLPIELLNSLLVPALVLLPARSPGYVCLIAGLSFLFIFLPIRTAGCALSFGMATQKLRRWALRLLGLSYLLMLPRQAIGHGVQQALLAAAAVTLVLVVQRSQKITTIFIHLVSKLMGRLSFPIYLLHWPILLAFLPSIHSLVVRTVPSSGFSILISAVVYVLATLLSSIPFEKLVDARAIEWGRQLRSRISF
jgi:peptidoglycan/LPS O-acetylase OafA/YrhL